MAGNRWKKAKNWKSLGLIVAIVTVFDANMWQKRNPWCVVDVHSKCLEHKP